MKRIFPYLTYAGSIPFLFCAVCLFFNISEIPILGSVEKTLAAYGLMIASFMSGSHWGQHLNLHNKWGFYLPILSNFNVIILWFAFLIASFETLFFLYALSFLILLMIDRKLFKENLINFNYWRARVSVTLIVIVSLVLAGFYS